MTIRQTLATDDLRGKRVLVTGCGPIGIFAVGICRAAGASRIIASDVNPRRLELAKQMGATHVVQPQEAKDAVMKATDGYGVDVVLRMDQLADDRRWLPITVRHEMGHVVTLDGAQPSRSDQWLAEGIAEWIGSWPDPARTSARMPSVRTVLGMMMLPPATIALPPLEQDAPTRLVDAFYGLGRLAVDCMARTYDQAALFDFVQAVLQEGNTLDDASRRAFGKPFATVDKACVRWIREQAA